MGESQTSGREGGVGTRCMSKRGKNANLRRALQNKKNISRVITAVRSLPRSVGMRARNGTRPITDVDAAESIRRDQPKGMRITSWSRSHRPIDTKPPH